MHHKKLLSEAEALQPWLVDTRRTLHAHPETEFDLSETLAFVEKELAAMGYTPKRCGRAGITATAGSGKRVFLLRADMDALPLKEESGLPFAAGNGNMHACGHDLHTAMLLGAARLLKEREQTLPGTVKFMFQSAEEIFEGAKDMIHAGVLENPRADAGMMLHVMSGMPIPAGSVIICDGGVSAPGADIFTVTVQGKGCHGSMPHTGVDPITAAAHIIIALQEIQARELSLADDAVLTIGSVHGGQAPNIIPDRVTLTGSIRTYDEQIREYLKERLRSICQGIAGAFRARAEVSFDRGCPVLQNDPELSTLAARSAKALLGENRAFTQGELLALSGGKPMRSTGSEDFAYVSQEIPTIMLSLAAGEPKKGHTNPLHHPAVTFDEDVLHIGSAVLANAAMDWLESHA